jgi:hypothetical protein
MHWVVGVTVKISDTDIRQFAVESTRWWLLASIHMLIVEIRFKNNYPNAQVVTWLDWKL